MAGATVNPNARVCSECNADFIVHQKRPKAKTCGDECKRLRFNRKQREYRSKLSPEDKVRQNRKSALMANYGLSIEQYDQMYREQHGKCKICDIHEDDAQRGRLYVDHCHSTEEVRGLLCGKCNTALGMFNDDIDAILRAADYLRGM
jgi:hypothetical protein